MVEHDMSMWNRNDASINFVMGTRARGIREYSVINPIFLNSLEICVTIVNVEYYNGGRICHRKNILNAVR